MNERGNRTPTTVDFVADRMRCCLKLIEGAKGRNEAEQRALLWMLGEEINGIQARLWRAAR